MTINNDPASPVSNGPRGGLPNRPGRPVRARPSPSDGTASGATVSTLAAATPPDGTASGAVPAGTVTTGAGGSTRAADPRSGVVGSSTGEEGWAVMTSQCSHGRCRATVGTLAPAPSP